MAHTFHQHYYHLVWSTKERRPLILNEYKDRIFEFLGGSLRTLGCVSLQTGGVKDHIHILAGIPPKYAVSEIVRDIKVASSKWINASLPKAIGFSWQERLWIFFSKHISKESCIKIYSKSRKAP